MAAVCFQSTDRSGPVEPMCGVPVAECVVKIQCELHSPMN